jgi:hypothetical protein
MDIYNEKHLIIRLYPSLWLKPYQHNNYRRSRRGRPTKIQRGKANNNEMPTQTAYVDWRTSDMGAVVGL